MDDIQASSAGGSNHFPIRRSMACSSDPGLKESNLLAGITVKEETVDFDPASSPDPLLLLAAQMPLPSRRRAYTRSGRSTAESSVCEVCQGELSRFDTLLQHKLLHFNTTHVCYVCDTYFVSVENLLLHMSGVHRDILGVYPKGDAFVCPICIQRFSSSKSLLRHQNLHARKEDFSCTICALDLLGCRALLTHLSSAHHKDMKVKIQSLFICIDCRSVFTSRDSYAFHMMMRAQNESCDSPQHDSHPFNPSSDTKQILTAPDLPNPNPHPSSSHHHHQPQHHQQRSNGDYHSSRSVSQRIHSEDGLRTGTFISPLNLSLAQRGSFVSGDDVGVSHRRERFHQTSPGLPPPPPPHRHEDTNTADAMVGNGSGSTSGRPHGGMIHHHHQTSVMDHSEGQSEVESKDDTGYDRVMSRWCFEANLHQEPSTGNTMSLAKSLHKRSKSAQVTDDQTTTSGVGQSKRIRSSESAPPEVMKQTNDEDGCRGNAFLPLSPSARRNSASGKNGDDEEGVEEEDEEQEHFRDTRSPSKSPPEVARYVGKHDRLESGETDMDKFRGKEGEGRRDGGEQGGGGGVGEEGGRAAESFPFDVRREAFGFRSRLIPQHHHHHQFHHHAQHQQQPRTEKLATAGGLVPSNGWESVDGSKPHFSVPHFASGRSMPPSSCAMTRDANKNATSGHCGGVGGGGGGDHATTEDILAFVGANRDSLMMCRHCNVIYTDQIIYYLHMGLHNLNNPWQCNLCGKVCTNAQQFSSHVIHY